MGSPLEGVVVLDLTRVLSGPMCCVILEDLGAEVLKVEMPETGDDSRAYGPYINKQSLYFMTANRGKKSIDLNLKTQGGKEILKALVKNADVLVENYRPGVMEKLGLGYDVLKEINPKLIYAAISGFGATGPDKSRAAYDVLVQAESGLMSITGMEGMPPVRVGYSVSDINGALFCAIGINAALYQREKTGLGQKIDIAMLDCQLSVLESALSRYEVTGQSPKPLGHRHPTITPFQAFKAKDHWFAIAAGNDNLFARLCDVIGKPQLVTDPRFVTNWERSQHLDEIGKEIQEVVETDDMQNWLDKLNSVGVPCAPVNDMSMVVKDKQLIARNMFVKCQDPYAGDVIVPGNPIKMSTIEEKDTRVAPPQVGQHRMEILNKYTQFTPEQIAQFEQEGTFTKAGKPLGGDK